MEPSPNSTNAVDYLFSVDESWDMEHCQSNMSMLLYSLVTFLYYLVVAQSTNCSCDPPLSHSELLAVLVMMPTCSLVIDPVRFVLQRSKQLNQIAF